MKKLQGGCMGSLLSLFMLALLIAEPALATDQPYLLGDWNGERTRLADEGIHFNLGYTGEAAHNFQGGKKALTRYADQWAFGVHLDLDKLWGWHGSDFRVVVTNRNGRDLSTDAGLAVYQQVQEVYGRGQTWYLTLFAFRQSFLGNRMQWGIGRLPVGSDFDDFSCDFQNLTFCGSTPGNISGDYWINWPASQWATWLKWRTSRETYVKLGAYQLNPNYIDRDWARANGWKLTFPGGTTGMLAPLELGWTPVLHGMRGNYVIGAWYDDAKSSDLFYDVHGEPMALTGEPPLEDKSHYGGYLSFQQRIAPAVALFLNATKADSRTSPTDRQFALGVECTAPFGRASDMIGFAIGATHGSGRLTAYQRLHNRLNPSAPVPIETGYEYATELFYNWSPIASISLRPNLQYVMHPGGTTHNRNVFVFGLKTIVAL